MHGSNHNLHEKNILKAISKQTNRDTIQTLITETTECKKMQLCQDYIWFFKNSFHV